MDLNQMQLVRTSFHAVHPQAKDLAVDFYARLFSQHPSLRRLFVADLTAQQRKFNTMINVLVEYLDQPAKLHPILVRLGAQHAGYGVTPEHYRIVGGVLLETLASVYGPVWIPEVAAAWLAVYRWVAREMQAGAFSAGQEDLPT